ncbi:hypothetical protein [Parabacteroides pacaensis]|uniref:hypothetical protein n=1 Tax=Parabacteroides pacaensis TaxID=2086575 RepID=UPI000D102A2B|nr:hypothetical protein [Parabacteroides pacaensis]
MAVSAFIGKYGHEAKKWAEELTCEDENYIIAIARKCPRLLETLIRENNILPASVLDRVITEHALPFHFASQPEWNKYHLCDDSILYGSTYKKIEMLLRTYAKFIRPEETEEQTAPLIKKSTLFRLQDENPLSGLEDIVSYHTGDECEMTTFINYEMSAFLRGAPYDLEFPVIYCTGDFNSKRIGTVIETLFPDRDNVFFQEEPILLHDAELAIRKSWTIIFRAVNERNINSTDPEFSKIRIFLNETETELRIVPFNPYPLPDDLFNRLASFFPERYQSLYADAYDKVKKYILFTPENADEEYMVYQTQRSMVIWANYLLSVNLFLQVWKEKESLFSDLGVKEWYLKKKDLQYLLGQELAGQFLPQLEDWINSKELMRPLVIDYSSVYFNRFEETQVPADYIETFKSEMMKAYRQADSINDLISSQFYCQHKYIDERSRRKEVDKYTRLRFGITYRGLYNHVLIYKNRPHFELEMHKVVDTQIDEGSIVPKYVKLTGGEKPVWIRMFRSGERISKNIEMKVLIFYLLQRLKEKLAATLVPKTVLEVFLLQSLSNTIHKPELHCIKDYPFALELGEINGMPLYCAALPVDGDKRIRITEWLEERGHIRSSISNYEIIADFQQQMFSYKNNSKLIGDIHQRTFPYKNVLFHVYEEMSNTFARLIDTYYNVKNYIFKISLAGLDKDNVKTIQQNILTRWKKNFEKWLEQDDNLKTETDLAACYQYIYEYDTYYRDETGKLPAEMDKVENTGTYWNYLKAGKKSPEMLSLWEYDKDTDNKFHIAGLLCAVYSLLYFKFSTIKPDDKVVETADVKVKLIWGYYKERTVDKNQGKLKEMCKQIMEEYFSDTGKV